jgi:hypothetical protein
MRLSRQVLHTAVAGVALGSGLIASQTAQAAISYDLRYVGGPVGSEATVDPAHIRQAVVGTYQLELWQRVSGTNATVTDESLTNSLITVVSTQVGGSAVTSGALAAGTTATPFNDPTTSRNGAAQIITADGVGDWGGTGTNQTDTNYMFARAATPPSGGGAVGQASGGGWEFKIATFDLVVNSVGSAGETRLGVVKPTATFNGSTLVPAVYTSTKVDNITTNITNANAAAQGTYTGSLGVSLVVPEPTSLGLVGAAAVGLLSRRRRS